MVDPFNWPMPKRTDLMSLSTLGQRDVTRVKTANYAKRIRDISNNLNSLDINGKFSINNKFGLGAQPRKLTREMNRAEF